MAATSKRLYPTLPRDEEAPGKRKHPGGKENHGHTPAKRPKIAGPLKVCRNKHP